MSVPQTEENFIWIEATGKPGMRCYHAHGTSEAAVQSHTAGVKALIHKTEVELYTAEGCFRVCVPQPPFGGSVQY